ncbi:MAG TPA: hypothetical protein VHQ93_15180 [Chitinophagaceae bacterium]|jgi:hypothetical protein|nr:hypothetical protein [Chitinophagaceae bacterium]
MKIQTVLNFRTIIISALVLSVSMMAHAQEKPANLDDDTTKYVPYRMMFGHRVAKSKFGELNIRPYTYLRYLNQKSLDITYTDGFGKTQTVDTRQDVQLQKVSIYFSGWAFDPKFTYFLYVWTTNASQGLGAQVVVAGNLSYTFNKHFKILGGIASLPGVRSTEGNYPFWLSVDNRMIADEYMRPSYTSGFRLSGEIVKKLSYQVMLGNNMSTLGVDAGQIDNKLSTVAAALVFVPTTGEYGIFNGSYGDYDMHEKVATRMGVHYTKSDETRQGQPENSAFENVSLRVSDGSSIFAPGLFAPGQQIDEARYQMFSFDAGAKFRGFALEGEIYWREIDRFRLISTPPSSPMPFDKLDDEGFQLLASAMVIPKKLQLYTTYSKIFGQYGDPSETRVGFNFFPFKKTIAVRLNGQATFMNRCPVGGLAYPYTVGANGTIFNFDLELNF